MACILGIGVATLDIINSVEGYPAEDAKVRAAGQRIRRGGNCANTLVVLSQLGHRCAWGGMLGDDSDGRMILADLHDAGIDTSACRLVHSGRTPVSYILQNLRNGSRTIVHYRDLPEFGCADFRKIDLAAFGWIHAEGRNCAATVEMLRHARTRVPALPCSIEIEKQRPGQERLFPLADVLLFSRGYALARGAPDATTFLHRMHAELPRTVLVCAWGEEGAWGIGADGALIHSPAFIPRRVVDTLGAGDTFNAGIIDACLREMDLDEALAYACQLAGRKCAHEGLTLRWIPPPLRDAVSPRPL